MDTPNPEEICRTAKRVSRSARAVSLLAQLARAGRGLRLWAMDDRPPGFAILERAGLATRRPGPVAGLDHAFATDLGRLVAVETNKLSPR